MRRRAALPLERKAAFPGHNPLVPVYLAGGFYKKLYTFPKTTGMKNNEHVIIKENSVGNPIKAELCQRGKRAVL
jgi:hypothetical protein